MPHSPDASELLYTLSILCDTPHELLHTYRNLDSWKQAKAVVNSITNKDADSEIQPTISESSYSSCPSSPAPSSNSSTNNSLSGITLPSARNISTTSPRKHQHESESNLNKLLDEIKKVLPKLAQFSNEKLQLQDILKETESPIEKQIQFLRIVDGNSTPTEQEILLMGLAQFSHASEFSLWQANRGLPLRVDEICSKLSKVPKRNGNIPRYLANENIPIEYQNVVSRGIREGLNKFAFEKLFHEKLEESMKDAATGMLAVLTLTYMKFRKLKFNQYPQFIDILLIGNAPIIGPLIGLSDWFLMLRSDFEVQYGRITTARETITQSIPNTPYTATWHQDGAVDSDKLNAFGGQSHNTQLSSSLRPGIQTAGPNNSYSSVVHNDLGGAVASELPREGFNIRNQTATRMNPTELGQQSKRRRLHQYHETSSPEFKSNMQQSFPEPRNMPDDSARLLAAACSPPQSQPLGAENYDPSHSPFTGE
ncbi:hypothetical protein PRK78_006563 [Emydomyces testavorans]|uniref:Uncharacterized protein n=1 Tax=Emydomyces testavorans TaxID=2070801 RepID=A0AAF0DLM8_9EURO|nr:hypothetical protein PRK78_006563 [Emydomyces testavorans]